MEEAPTQTGRRVLLVDDDAALLRNYRWCLEDAGFHVVTAQNGEQAHRAESGQKDGAEHRLNVFA